MKNNITAFQDEHGRVTTWPSDRRHASQHAVLEHLRLLFEVGVGYSRAEALALLADHALPDSELLLRELLDADYLVTQEERLWRADGRPAPRPAP